MMQANLIGVVSVYVLHATALVFLCPSKYSWSKVVGLWGIMIPAFSLLCFFLFHWQPNQIGIALALIITGAMGIMTVLWLSSYESSKTLFLFLTYIHVFIMILYGAKVISLYFFEDSQTVMIVIRTALHFALVVLCIIFVRRKFRDVSQDITKGWWPLNFVILLLFMNAGSFVVRCFLTGYTGDDVLPFLLMLFITAAVYWLFFNTIRYMNIARKNEKIQLQSQFLMRQVSDMQESIENAKRIRHDARHHNMQIAGYAQTGKMEELLSYLGQYEQEAESHAFVTLCKNHAANSILNAYVHKARQQDIEVRLTITLEQNISISDIDLVAILANLMENAINGCMQSGEPHPFIDLYIGRKASKLIIHIQNTAGCGVILENGLPKARDGESIGTSSILHSASKYGGEYDFKMEDGLFSCQLLLKASKSVASVFSK